MRPAERICAHCERPMRGMASAGDAWLCHPDYGVDCYHLVTLYGHKMPCDRLEDEKRYFEAVDEFIAFLEHPA